MTTSSHYPYPIPNTPRVTSPSPTPSESGSQSKESYFGPVTRSISRAGSRVAPALITEEQSPNGSSSDSEKRSRPRRRPAQGSKSQLGKVAANIGEVDTVPEMKDYRSDLSGHLSPVAAYYMIARGISRSPSPLGLIPIHRHWKSFVHKYEVPRKLLHVSIGFLVLYLYYAGAQPASVSPVLLTTLLPIATADFLRHRLESFNRFYVRVLGALMRESEFHGWNGTIWYLLGTLIAVQLFPKDIGIVAVLLLSWCDTAASTGGRLWGQYTPKIRQGKTWAGSIAAAITGGITAAFFWGFFAPRFGAVFDFEENVFAYQGSLSLPAALARNLGFTGVPTIRGNLALGVISIWAGFVASASEVVDLFGWDDNLTIPALCSVGLWGFLKAFGGQAL